MKQKKEITALAVLVVIAAVVWFFYFQREKPTVTADVVAEAQNGQLLPVENPALHIDRVDRARKSEYKSSGRNIFSREVPLPPKPKQPPKTEPEKPPEPPPAPIPVVSQLPVRFFGYGTVPYGTSRRAFFTNGEDVYVVGEGDILLNRFRILKIGNANLEYEEISTGLRGTANLEEQPAGPST